MSPRDNKNLAERALEPQRIGKDEIVEFSAYVRKSNENDEKQRASIPQQIQRCYENRDKDIVFRRRNLKRNPIDDLTLAEIDEAFSTTPVLAESLKDFYVHHDIYCERASAKEPFNRKIWRSIVEQVKKGKIRGLFGYSPDRFSRNLQEGGEITNYVSASVLRLKFDTFHFENSATGHMMLGVFFVFAEHYSKKLAEDTSRGMIQKHLEGQAQGQGMLGYVIKKGYFYPHPKNFKIMRWAFKEKIKNNSSDTLIASGMMKRGFVQQGKQKLPTAQVISHRGIWTNDFYYGRWTREFNGEYYPVDLRVQDQFEPVITEAEFYELQRVRSGLTEKAKKRKRTMTEKALDVVRPLPNIVQDSDGMKLPFSIANRKRHDGNLEKMIAKTGKKDLTLADVVKPHQIRFKRPNKTNHNKGTNNITFDLIDSAIQALWKTIDLEKLESSDGQKAFDLFRANEIERLFHEDGVFIKTNNAQIAQANKMLKGLLRDRAAILGKEKNKDKEKKMLAVVDKKIEVFETKVAELKKDRAEFIETRRDFSLEATSFVEVMKQLPHLWNKMDYVEKHKVAEIMLFHIEVEGGKVTDIVLKKPYQDFFDSTIPMWLPGWDSNPRPIG